MTGRLAGLLLILACVGGTADAGNFKPAPNVAQPRPEATPRAAAEPSPARQSLGREDFYDPSNPFNRQVA